MPKTMTKNKDIQEHCYTCNRANFPMVVLHENAPKMEQKVGVPNGTSMCKMALHVCKMSLQVCKMSLHVGKMAFAYILSNHYSVIIARGPLLSEHVAVEPLADRRAFKNVIKLEDKLT